MTVLLGMAAMSVDSSYMYDKRNRLHAAADAAAKSAAIEVHRNGTISHASLLAFAKQQVAWNGFPPSSGTNVTVNWPPASGSYVSNSSFVEVIVSQPSSTFFANVLGLHSMTPAARAVAGGANPESCFITLRRPGSTPAALEIGNTTLTLDNCDISTAGDLVGSNPNSTINGTPTPAVQVSGLCSGTCSSMGSLSTGTPDPTDPLTGLAAPSNPGGCSAGTATILRPGCYSSIASSVKTLNSGLYYITGPVDIGNLSGSEVTLYLTGAGRLTAKSNKSLTLTAPTTGTHAGIAIFQDATDTNDVDIENHFTMSLEGVIYMPGTDIDFKNHLTFTNTGCTLIIAKSLNIGHGAGSLSTTGCSQAFQTGSFLSAALAE